MTTGRWWAVSLCLVILGALAFGARARAAEPTYWSSEKVMRMIDGARVPVARRRIRIASNSGLCSGEGRSIRRGDVRLWQRFQCTYTTFSSGGIDRDLEFHVVVDAPRRFRIVGAHWVGTAR